MTVDIRSSIQLLASALVQELGAALGEAVGATPSLVATREPIDIAWTVTIRVGTPAAGAVTIGMSREHAAALARVVTDGGEAAADAAIVDFLQQLAGRAVEALRGKPAGEGILFCVESPCAITAPPRAEAHAYAVSLTPDLSPVLAVWTVFEDAPAQQAGASSLAFVQDSPTDREAVPVPANLDVILDIDLPLSVRFGQTEMTVEALTRLGPGSLIDLERSPEDPVEVLVNGRLVARAEVVVVGGSYGVRILEVVSAADRVRSFGRA
jgi:flagellar motor switch protein FliN/FliY